jgi:two-component system sensor histidine kinase DegS
MHQLGDGTVNMLEEMRREYDKVQRQLDEMESLIEQSRLDVNKLTQRNQSIGNRLRYIEDNFDTVPRSDIRSVYDSALDNTRRLLSIRGQLEKLESDQNALERLRTLLEDMINFLEQIDPDSLKQDGSPKKETESGMGPGMIVRIIDAQEAERLRLSNQLHDGPAQSLTNFVLQAEICQKLFDRDPSMAAEELENLKASAHGTFKKVRGMIMELRPMMLSDLGLVPTVRRYVETFEEKMGVSARINIMGEERRLESHREVLLFRGIQTLMSNACDQGGATEINVTLDMGDANESYVRAIVENDGDPLNVDDMLSGGSKDLPLHLATLREQIELLEGDIQAQSSENGTRVTIQLLGVEPVEEEIPAA